MLIKNKYLVLGLLLVAIFSLNTIFGTPLGEAHPKKLLDKTSSFSQLYTSYVTDLEALSTPAIFEYIHLIDSSLVSAAQYFQEIVMVTLRQQKLVTLSITSFSNNTFIYLKKKILSQRETLITVFNLLSTSDS